MAVQAPVQVRVELPNLRAPVGLIVDDGARGHNLVAHHRRLEGDFTTPYEPRIPQSFMESFCQWVGESRVKGCFSVVPCPVGLGRIDQSIEGVSDDELKSWLQLARDNISPRFDIHPEIVTHGLAVEVPSLRPLALNEQEWAEYQHQGALAEYFAFAMTVLKNAGLESNGLTQPWAFRGDEHVYARAMLEAENKVHGRKISHHFIHVDEWAERVPARILLADTETGSAAASVWTCTNDSLWNSLEPHSPEFSSAANVFADKYISEDGQHGRIPQMIRNGSPAMFVTHWQGLFSNGSGKGLEAMRQVVARIDEHYGDKIEWVKASQMVQRQLAAEFVNVTTKATQLGARLEIESPFDTDVLTLSVVLPWISDHPYVSCRVGNEVEPLHRVGRAFQLAAKTWMQHGFELTLSIPLRAKETTVINIQRFYK